jgi:hypothetical protein
MRVLLRDLAPGQDYAIQFRSNDGEGNTSDWSQVQRFTTTNDLLSPADVTGLSWSLSGSSFIGTWNKVTKNADNSTLKDFRDYHCIVSNGINSVNFYVPGERFEFTQEQNITAFGALQDGLTLTVTARDLTYNESLHPAVVTAAPSNPPTPSTPTVTNYLGLLQVNVDGKDSGGTAMPRNITYYEIHVGTASGFATSTSTYNGRLTIIGGQKASYIISGGLTYGTPVFVRVVAVNTLGNKSTTASGTASGTPTRISGLDITPNGISPAQINFSAKDIGGANAYYGATAPTTTTVPGGFKTGDVWYDTSDHYNPHVYDSSIPGFKSTVDPNIGVVSGTKIIAGTVTSDAVGTNLLITAAANIGTAVIDSASLSYVDAGKITAGILQSKATASYGGVTQPAWSLDINGNAVLNNTTVYGTLTLGKSGASSTNNASAMVKSYNYTAGSAGWAIKGDGSVEFTNGTFRGSLVTGTGASGSRYMKVGGTAQHRND